MQKFSSSRLKDNKRRNAPVMQFAKEVKSQSSVRYKKTRTLAFLHTHRSNAVTARSKENSPRFTGVSVQCGGGGGGSTQIMPDEISRTRVSRYLIIFTLKFRAYETICYLSLFTLTSWRGGGITVSGYRSYVTI